MKVKSGFLKNSFSSNLDDLQVSKQESNLREWRQLIKQVW